MSLSFGVELLVGRVKVSDVCMYKSINNQLWNLRGVGGERWGNTICGSKDYTSWAGLLHGSSGCNIYHRVGII